MSASSFSSSPEDEGWWEGRDFRFPPFTGFVVVDLGRGGLNAVEAFRFEGLDVEAGMSLKSVESSLI